MASDRRRIGVGSASDRLAVRALIACVLLLSPAACRRQSQPTHDSPRAAASRGDNGPRWTRVPPRPWLGPRVRDVSIEAFTDGYESFVARLDDALRAPPREPGRPSDAQRDSALRLAWADALGDFHAWMDEIGLVPLGRGISPEVIDFLDSECKGDRALTAAPVALGVIARDPGGEPDGLVGRLVRQPPQGSLAVRKFALEAIGFTNRAEYLPLLERVAAEPGPYAALAIRAAGLMDGGTAIIRRALHAPEDRFTSDVVHALVRSPDSAAAADLVRALATTGQDRALEISLVVMERRGALADLRPVVTAALTRPTLSDRARDAAAHALREMDPQAAAAIAATNDAREVPASLERNPNGTGRQQ